MWNHYNLLEEENYTKYLKYVNRFQTMLTSSAIKVFMYIQYYDTTLDEVIDFNTYLQDHIKDYVLICIHCKKTEHPSSTLLPSYEKDNLYVYDLEIDKWEDELPLSALEDIKKKILIHITSEK
jgi:hypothetical protein